MSVCEVATGTIIKTILLLHYHNVSSVAWIQCGQAVLAAQHTAVHIFDVGEDCLEQVGKWKVKALEAYTVICRVAFCIIVVMFVCILTRCYTAGWSCCGSVCVPLWLCAIENSGSNLLCTSVLH